MEELLNLIRAAGATEATPAARQAAATACRTLLLALEAAPGEAMASEAAPTAAEADTASKVGVAQPQLVEPLASAAAPVPAPAQAAPIAPAPPQSPALLLPGTLGVPIDPTSVAAIVASLRGIPPDQLLDMAIERLRAALPPAQGAAPHAAAPPVRFQLVPVPPQWKPNARARSK